MNIFKWLWERWIGFTIDVAQKNGEMDMLIYGTFCMEEKWWGFKWVPYKKAIKDARFNFPRLTEVDRWTSPKD